MRGVATWSRCVPFALSLSGLLAGCEPMAPAPDELETKAHGLRSDLDPMRSLVVTEKVILERFSFERVMNQLVADSGVPGLTALDLFHQWFDTQNPAAEAIGPGIHCDDVSDGAGNGLINDYPYLCRPRSLGQEGLEATTDPFSNPESSDDAYIPVALFNRFDLAPANGANCGEHRIVYARRSGLDPLKRRSRNYLIFEATMPNLKPGQGLKGCQKVVRFWADLSSMDNLEARASELERFYFRGIANLPPVVSVAHLGDNPDGVGQVRTNQFMQPAPANIWNLREFKLRRTCSEGSCSAMSFVPVTVKGNPFGPLFSASSTHPQKAAFDAHFLTQVESLAAGSLAEISMSIPDQFNTAQSLASASTENNYLTQFAGPSPLRDGIQAVLTSLGSTLTPDHIVKRARAMSCAGCHRLSQASASLPGNEDLGGGLSWPSAIGFAHASEQGGTVVGYDGIERFPISSALTEAFLPVRQQVMIDYLENKPFNTRRPEDPIGGRRVH